MTTATRVEATLLAVTAYGLPGSMLDLPAAPLPALDWRRLLHQAEDQRLTGLLAAAVENGAMPVTAEQREQVEQAHVGAMVRTLLLERTMLDVVERLVDAGVPSRLLKGSAVAHLDYPDPALRPFGDVDLLVRGPDLDRAMEVLRRAGMAARFSQPRPGFGARFGKGVTMVAADGTEIDLHRTLAHGSFGFSVPLDRLWQTSSTIRLGGRTIRALGAEDRLLHAAYHLLLGTRPVRLLPLRDLAEMALYGQHDDHALRERAAEWKAEVVLAAAVRETWRRLDIADVTRLSQWAERRVPSASERQQLTAYDHAGNPYSARAIEALPHVPGLRGKVAFARSLALPDRDFLASRGETRRSWLMRGVRVARQRGQVTDRG